MSVAGFCKTAAEGADTEATAIDNLKPFVRGQVEAHHLSRGGAGEEFFKLAIELGLKDYWCLTARSAARITGRAELLDNQVQAFS